MSSGFDAEILRIGTAEREEATRALGEHFAAGRLTTAEYEQRVSGVIEARTRADVRPLFADLPEPHPLFLSRAAELQPAPDAPLPVPATSDRSSIIAGILQIVLPFGTGRFYTGETRLAVAQLLVTLFTAGVGAIWPFVDGILLLVRGGTDGEGRPLSR